MTVGRKLSPMVKAPAESHARGSYGLLYWWLLAVLFFEYARPASYVPALGVIPLNALLPLTLAVTCLFAKGLRPFKEIFSSRTSKWITAYVALIALSVLTADVTFQAYSVFTLSFGYFLLFVMVSRIVQTERQLLGVVLVLAIAHVFLIAMNPSLINDPTVRAYVVGATFLGDGNDFGLSVCIVLPFVLEASVRSKSLLWRVVMWSLAGLLLIAIVGTSSRGATLGAGAVLAFLWLFASKKFAGLFALAVVALGVVAYAPASYFERMRTISNYDNEGSAQGRIIAWKAATRMALDNPLTGVSAGHFPIAFGTKYMPADQQHLPWLTAHSIYFLILGELGFPGLIVLLAMLFGNILANLRLRRRILQIMGGTLGPEALATVRLLAMGAAGVIGFAVAGAFLSAAYYPHVYMICGLLVAQRAIAGKLLEGRGDVPNPVAFRARYGHGGTRRLTGAK